MVARRIRPPLTIAEARDYLDWLDNQPVDEEVRLAAQRIVDELLSPQAAVVDALERIAENMRRAADLLEGK